MQRGGELPYCNLRLGIVVVTSIHECLHTTNALKLEVICAGVSMRLKICAVSGPSSSNVPIVASFRNRSQVKRGQFIVVVGSDPSAVLEQYADEIAIVFRGGQM